MHVQVCSYRVIASYESPLFEAFSKCILQRHNCMGNSADIPMVPDPVPLSEFRGAEVSWDTAEDIFIGHLSPQAPRGAGGIQEGFSWRVACGKNPGTTTSYSKHATCASLSLQTVPARSHMSQICWRARS